MRLFIILASILAKFGEFDRKGTLPPSPPRNVDWVFIIVAAFLFAGMLWLASRPVTGVMR